MNSVKRKFSALVANMLDAEANGRWEEYNAFKRKVNEWQEKFSLDLEKDKDAPRNWATHNFQAIPELATKHNIPTWFKWLLGTVAEVFGVGVLHSQGTFADIITDNQDLLEEVLEFAEVVQRQMLLYQQNNKEIKNKPQYYSGFINGVYQKLKSQQKSLILVSRSKEALDWHKNQLQIKTKSCKSNARATADYYKGIHDGQNRGTRLKETFGQKLLK